MNSLIESLNIWGAHLLNFAWTLFWQSSLLIALVVAIDCLLRRKARPAVRYALWLVVAVKLILPPSLALPTGPAWWLRARQAPLPQAPAKVLATTTFASPAHARISQPTATPLLLPPPPELSLSAWAMLLSAFVSILLVAWAGVRWRKIRRCIRHTTSPGELVFELFAQTRRKVAVGNNVTIRLTAQAMSPAVCGLWRPVILLPQLLVERLSREQLRAVLLHELIHIRRRDTWMNCAQTLLQIAYWWHPLVWFANARIRRVREEAVDDAVMFALNDEAEIYAPTLLEVAKLAFNRPFAGLGIVGILESRTALRHRIERLLNFKTPGRAGLSAVWILALTAFAAVAVPMGEPAEKSAPNDASAPPPGSNQIGIPGASSGPASQSFHEAAIYYSNLLKQAQAEKPGTNALYTNPSRQKILQKLTSITFDHISFTDTPLSEVVLTLNEQSRQLDPEREGVVITIDTNGPAPNAPKMDPNQVIIHLRPELKNVRLIDVLEAITKSTDRPLQYSLLDNGVEFAVRGPQSPELFTRTFKIDSDAFHRRLDQLGLHSTNVQELTLNFFAAAGVNFGPPKSVFFNDRKGTLTVRGTADDLDAAEQVLETLESQSGTVTNEAAPRMQDAKIPSERAQIQVWTNQVQQLFEGGKLDQAWGILQKILNVDPDNQAALYYSGLIKQARLPKAADGTKGAIPQQLPPQNLPLLAIRTFKLDVGTLGQNLGHIKSPADIQPALSNLFQQAGLDMQPPKSYYFNQHQGMLTVRATTNDLNMLEAILATLNTPSPEVTIKARFIEIDPSHGGIDALVKKSLSHNNSGPDGKKAGTGILTHDQFAPVLQALEKDKGYATLVNEGEVTTLSGRQAQFQIVDIKTLMNGVNATVTNNQTTYNYKTTRAPFGSTLDVVPHVSADGDTILMTVTPTVTEFLGYENPKEISKYDQKLRHARLPLPKTRVRQTTTTARIQDGQTLVIGDLSDESIVDEPDGTKLRQPYAGKKKKQLMIFVTATIVDPSGKPVHPRDSYDDSLVR